ncbi:MAG: hypothetical protein Tsb0020_16350 [Haliangiales bacterium]
MHMWVENGRIKVLLVDDISINRKVAQNMLHKLGCECDMVQNGSEAVDAVLGGDYDLVLMDCLMPVMDGYEATLQIRRCEGKARQTPIVALTAAVMDEDRQKCLDVGMNDIIAKPLSISNLRVIISNYVGHLLA